MLKLFVTLMILGFALSIYDSAGAAGDTSIDSALRTIASTPAYSEVAISPDGGSLAWVERSTDAAGSSQSRVWISASRGGVARRISALAAGDSRALQERAISWSPDGSALAFLSDADAPGGQQQLYQYVLSTQRLARLTQVQGTLASPRWAPNGTEIAVLFTRDAQREAGPLAAVPVPTGVIDEAVLEQRLALVSPTTSALRVVTPADLYVYEYDWSPDGNAIVATAAHGSGDNHWYTADLYRFDLGTGAARILHHPAQQIAAPRWSADGRQIAFIGGLMSDESIANGDPYVISAQGGEARQLATLSGSAFSLDWLPDS